MNTGSKTPHYLANAPGCWQTVRRGIFLGAGVSTFGSALLIAVGLAVLGKKEILSGSGEYWLIILLGLGVLVVTILPASVGGGVNALMIYALARRRAVAVREGLFVGALLGLLWGLAAIGIASLVTIDWWLPLDELAWLEGIAALVGSWHGWRMVRYLQKTTGAD